MANQIFGYTCTICNQTFKGKPNLRSHLRTVHKDEEPCPLCGLTVKDLIQHKRRIHGVRSPRTPLPRRQCKHCHRWFVSIVRHKCKKDPFVLSCVIGNVGVHRFPSLVAYHANIPSPKFPHTRSLPSSSISPPSLGEPLETYPSPIRRTRTPDNNSQWEDIEIALSQSIPFDPTSVSPEAASEYPSSLDSTLSVPLGRTIHQEESNPTTMIDMHNRPSSPDCDIPVPSIEPPDVDHPPTDEFNVIDFLRGNESSEELEESSLNEWD